MNENTLQTIVDTVKDLSGQDNAPLAKIIRGINYGVDDYTRQRILASGRFSPDSTSHGNIARITTTITSSDSKVSLPVELIAIRQVEVTDDNGKYQIVEPVDIQDYPDTPLETMYPNTGMPQVYDVESEHIYTFPTTDQSRTMRITYQRAHPRFTVSDLTNGVGVLPIDEEYVALYATDYIMIGSSDTARVAVAQKLEQKRREIKDMFGRRDQDRARKLRNVAFAAFTSNPFKK